MENQQEVNESITHNEKKNERDITRCREPALSGMLEADET